MLETAPDCPPPRPDAWRERWSLRLFLSASPPLEVVEMPGVPDSLQPCEEVWVPRVGSEGALSAAWFPVSSAARGAVLLLHPWLSWGKSYFHRRGRIAALRDAGYHVLTLDLSGFGHSPRAATYFDRDVEAGLAWLRGRAPGLPLHIWGVSSGGYWAHPVLSRDSGVTAAMFEDVASHLLVWSWRMVPRYRPVYLTYRTVFRAPYRFLDIRRHARCFRLGAVTYVSGERDRGVPPEETRELAQAAGGESWIVPAAGHLESIKREQEGVIELALETFRCGESQVSAGS